MSKEEFEKKAVELFNRHSHQESHGGDLVVGENSFDYIIEELHEALTSELFEPTTITNDKNNG